MNKKLLMIAGLCVLVLIAGTFLWANKGYSAQPWITEERLAQFKAGLTAEYDQKYAKLVGGNEFHGLQVIYSAQYGDAILLRPEPGSEATNPQRKANIIWQADDGQLVGIVVAHKDADSNHFSIYTAGPTPGGGDVVKALDLGMEQAVLYGNTRLIMPDGSAWKITEGDIPGTLRLWRVADWGLMEQWPNP